MSANKFDVSNVLKRIESLLAAARRGAQSAQALGNWAQVIAVAGKTLNSPVAQTAPSSTTVVALSVVPKSTGLFLVGCKASWSDNTTADAVGHSLVSKQGATAAGVLAGANFLSQVKMGAFATTAKGGVQNADAAGGPGITFEGVPVPVTVVHSADTVATLTGLLTGQGIGTQNFESGFVMVDAAGSSSATKTPFTLGLAACIALQVTAARVVAYDSVHLFAAELPYG